MPLSSVVHRFSGLELKQRGREWWACCPFHAEKTPSLAVNDEKGLYFCHGCQAGGSAADFVMRLRGVDFRDAVALIEQAFGLAGESTPRPRPMKSQATVIAEEIQQAFDFCFAARQIIRDEISRRGSAPEHLLEKLGAVEIIEAEISSGEPERVAAGLRMWRGWRHVKESGD